MTAQTAKSTRTAKTATAAERAKRHDAALKEAIATALIAAGHRPAAERVAFAGEVARQAYIARRFEERPLPLAIDPEAVEVAARAAAVARWAPLSSDEVAEAVAIAAMSRGPEASRAAIAAEAVDAYAFRSTIPLQGQAAAQQELYSEWRASAELAATVEAELDRRKVPRVAA